MSEHYIWEGEVTNEVAVALEIKYSDAAGIVEAQPFYMAQSWSKGLDPKATAAKLIDNPVEIEPIHASSDDLVGARITANNATVDVDFALGSNDLRDKVQNAIGVDLSTDHLMTVTEWSRKQLLTEARRIWERLNQLPAGTVAVIAENDHCWIDPNFPKELTNSQDFNSIGNGADDSLVVSDFGPLDTEEYHAIANSFRKWLDNPVTVQVDPSKITSSSV